MRIVLKSASERRKELLKEAGYSFVCCPADIDETMDEKKTPEENVRNLGLKKALWNQEQFPSDLLIGCDTIVVLSDRIFGKPKDEQDAYRMLSELSGKMHTVMSGVGLVYQNRQMSFVVQSKVFFKKLTEEEIRDYIRTKECFGKAGSYAIQGIGKKLVDNYEGSYSNIVGLPMEELKKKMGEILEMEN